MGSESWPSPNEEIKYAKGENRRKHLGLSNEACMVHEPGNNWVGKCPRGFSLDVAAKLLEHAVPEFRDTTAERPYRLWTYHDGAVYAARSEDGGKTWHGYPNGHPMLPPPRAIMKLLEKHAEEAGEGDRLKAWLKKRWNAKQ
ncbi:hypothetical protein [Burkholderia gladioli]|uniref:hypothetical protein n=1 Tax=Burkholderia gladioli TaxID=28095 RepID=UPI0016404114|nr:hypothetical protein [Burkholderia gladioli]